MADILFDDAQNKVVVDGDAQFTNGDVELSSQLKVVGDTLRHPTSSAPTLTLDQAQGKVRVSGNMEVTGNFNTLTNDLRVSNDQILPKNQSSPSAQFEASTQNLVLRGNSVNVQDCDVRVQNSTDSRRIFLGKTGQANVERLNVADTSNFQGDVTMTDDLNVLGIVDVSGDLDVCGDIIAQEDILVEGQVRLDGGKLHLDTPVSDIMITPANGSAPVSLRFILDTLGYPGLI